MAISREFRHFSLKGSFEAPGGDNMEFQRERGEKFIILNLCQTQNVESFGGGGKGGGFAPDHPLNSSTVAIYSSMQEYFMSFNNKL